MEILPRNCIICGKEFVPFASNLRHGQGKCCSQKCGGISKRGRHHSKEAIEKMKKAAAGRYSGQENPNWKGGKVKIMQGYVMIFNSIHPWANNRGYVLEHRLVMEKHIGRYLSPDEVVHHINGIKDDNRIENLELFESQSEHVIFHCATFIAKKCSVCNLVHHAKGFCNMHYMQFKRGKLQFNT